MKKNCPKKGWPVDDGPVDDGLMGRDAANVTTGSSFTFFSVIKACHATMLAIAGTW